MDHEVWQDILLSEHDEGYAWELFHENSKLSRYHQAPSNEEILTWMNEQHESLPFDGCPVIELPASLPSLTAALDDVLLARTSTLRFASGSITLPNVATVLQRSYGVTRDNKGTRFPRPFRIVPSGGALYPLELFFYAQEVDGLKRGLYHFNPCHSNVRLIRSGEAIQTICDAMTEPNVPIIQNAPFLLFITAIFERSIFKYGERGYRFILLEAGHVAQNSNLVSGALGLGCLNIGGFFDRRLDCFLNLDGITHSTIYVIAIGKKQLEP